jgi:hypothetical protein
MGRLVGLYLNDMVADLSLNNLRPTADFKAESGFFNFR